ncbi:hypothetical protein PI125_g9636 [Phytophthora idaei]|nr:hypothetical protein PI125_g9636 [Phytophthora idaei]
MDTLGKRNKKGDDRLKIVECFMYSRKREEYLAAIPNPDFYATVVDKFDATSISDVNDESDDDESLNEKDEKTIVLDQKFYFAGGSCRFMFQYTTNEVKGILNNALGQN